VLLVAAGTNYALGPLPDGGAAGLAGSIVLELVGGLLLGLVVGFLGVVMLRRVALPATGLYPVAALAWAITAYGLGVWLHLSGFAAVYVCAVVLGNGNLPHRHAIRSFAEGIGWIAQIGLFTMLGLLAVHEHISWTDIGIGVAAGCFLTLVARPLSVLASSVWFKVPWREQAFLSWAGLRGAVPIILATVPLAAQINDAELLFDIVVVFVIVFTALQAPTLPWVARKLRLVDPVVATDLDIEVAPLEERRADLLYLNISPGSKLANLAVCELRLPADAVVALVMRGTETFSPQDNTVLRTGDDLLIVTPAPLRDQVEERLIQMGRHGRFARWKQRPR
jgi:cell volume regulation protein A